MLSVGLHPYSATTSSHHENRHLGTSAVPARTRPCVVSLCRADVAANAERHSTSYAVPVPPWRSHYQPTTERYVAASALPAADRHPNLLKSHSSANDGKVGVVIVDHGSRKKTSNDMLVEFGELYGRVTGHEVVEIAHMEIAAPTIEEAVGRCAARGARTVVVAPYFLSRGRHIQEDIPALVRQAQARHPGLQCVIAEPIGIDVLMVQLISNRVAAALSSLEQHQMGEEGKAVGLTVAAGATGAAAEAS